MNPEKIISNMIDGFNPVSGEKFPDSSPWNNPQVIRALFSVLQAVNPTSTVESVSESSSSDDTDSRVVGMPEPDIGHLSTLIRERTNIKICAHCHSQLRGNYLTITAEDDVFSFCDDECFQLELRALGRLFGWVNMFDSTLDDAKPLCSVCRVEINRDAHEHLNFVLHDRSFNSAGEVAILCNSCREKFSDYWSSYQQGGQRG